MRLGVRRNGRNRGVTIASRTSNANAARATSSAFASRAPADTPVSMEQDRAFDLEPGRVFAGDYKIVRRLSSGGMGSVYVAEQLSTSKQRALKLMRPELLSSPELRR